MAKEQQELKMKQVVAAQWSTEEGVESYSVVGLSTDGKVYRYDVSKGGWVAWSMREVELTRRR